MATSSAILQSYLLECFKNKEEPRFEELLKRSREKYAGDFLTPLNFYLGILDDTQKLIIPFMSQKKQDQLRHELQIAYLLLLTQKEYELTHQKTENEKKYDAKIKQCEELLDELNPVLQAALKQSPVLEYSVDGRPVKYCGIPLAKEFVDQLMNLIDRKSKTLKEAEVPNGEAVEQSDEWLGSKSKALKELIGAINEKRLYWVWGSSFLKTMMAMLPADFYNASQAADNIKTPDPYTGTLSWAMYYFRFFLNLFLLLKHTIKGPWMESEEERNTPIWERFKTQWAQRKFVLLNDSLWGTANLVCFFWLNGTGIMGTWGDALTLVLLVFDVFVALWDFAEQQVQYEAQMLQFDVDIKNLTDARMDLLSKDLKDEEAKKERDLKLIQLQLQINTLEKERTKCDRDWQLQKLSLYNNAGYAIGLTLAFIVLTMPFIPLTAATALALGIAGAVICFAFTLINNAIRGGIEVHKSRHALKDAKKEYETNIKLLKAELKNKPDSIATNDNAKFLYLEIMKCEAETDYQREMVVLQTIHLVRSIMLEVCVPAIIFSCLVFMPLGVGIGVMAGALGLAIASNLLVNALFQPDEKMKEIPPFDEEAYKSFCHEIPRISSRATGFFGKSSEEEPILSPEDDDYGLIL